MDDMEDLIAKIDALFGKAEPRDFFEAISPLLKQGEITAPVHMRAAIPATADMLQLTVTTLSKFDLGQDWIQETKLQRNKDLLQAALYEAFLLGSITASVPEAEKYRNDHLSQYFVESAAKARAFDEPRRERVALIVREEAEAYWGQHPSSKLSAEAIAERIMSQVNERLLAAKNAGAVRIGSLGKSALAKRIRQLKIRMPDQPSDKDADA